MIDLDKGEMPEDDEKEIFIIELFGVSGKSYPLLFPCDDINEAMAMLFDTGLYDVCDQTPEFAEDYAKAMN